MSAANPFDNDASMADMTRRHTPAMPAPSAAAPESMDWATVSLPKTWPDITPWWQPAMARKLFSKFRGKQRSRVELPQNLPGAQCLPKYLLQEFHNLPNGNYSHRVTRGYVRGFERAMLGHMRRGRAQVAASLRKAERAVDIGCGAGYLAAALHQAGVDEVWALEPSPYLLSLAARQHSGIHWRQGVAEDSGLPDGYFDAVGISFVLHEIPPHYLRGFCAELRRITRPGARLALLEPSPLQWRESAGTLFRRHGWRGVYFWWMARRVFEPFADAWHKLDFPALLAEHGFVVTRDDVGCPFRFLVAERIDEVSQINSTGKQA
ncbi:MULTISPECIES: class I SAM-dependent methyltransferase [unclassified Pseudoxanthomonas]|uniref:class I SAM-dependent methyltransferase n=1 Tax=unclassified Pseudoxanthomonas TaxID=2645906 RepID=UPI003076F6FB